MRVFIQIGILTAAYMLVCITALGQIDKQNIAEYIQKAHEAKVRFQFEEALALYNKVIQLEPQNPDHYVEISKLRIGAGDVEESYNALQNALQLDDRHAEALLFLAIYYQDEKQDYPEAERLLKKALRHHSNHAQIQKLYIENLIEQRELKPAFEFIEQMSPAPHPDGYVDFLMGKISFLQHDIEPAFAAFQQSLQKGYTSTELHRFLAQICHQKNMPEQAKKHQEQFQELTRVENERKKLRQLVRLNPNDASRWFSLGFHFLSSHELKDALSHLQRGLELDPSQAKIQSLAGKLALQLKQPSQAILFIQKALEINPDTAEDWNNLGVCYIMTEQYEKAIQAFNASIQKGNTSSQTQSNLNLAKSKLKSNQ